MKELVGVSVPFRIGNSGGIALSKANSRESTHLDESIQQIVGTSLGERIMERIGGNIDTHIFDINDVSAQSLISYELINLINEQDTRITATNIELESQGTILVATIYYVVKATNQYKTTSTTLNIGGEDNE